MNSNLVQTMAPEASCKIGWNLPLPCQNGKPCLRMRARIMTRILLLIPKSKLSGRLSEQVDRGFLKMLAPSGSLKQNPTAWDFSLRSAQARQGPDSCYSGELLEVLHMFPEYSLFIHSPQNSHISLDPQGEPVLRNTHTARPNSLIGSTTGRPKT